MNHNSTTTWLNVLEVPCLHFKGSQLKMFSFEWECFLIDNNVIYVIIPRPRPHLPPPPSACLLSHGTWKFPELSPLLSELQLSSA